MSRFPVKIQRRFFFIKIKKLCILLFVYLLDLTEKRGIFT